eukprot:tig00020681_g12837.t1
MKTLCKILEDRKISYWLDIAGDNGILKGVQWGKAIAAGIKGASVILVILTPDWIQSTYCIDEFDYALANQKRIVVVEVTPVEEHHLALRGPCTEKERSFNR